MKKIIENGTGRNITVTGLQDTFSVSQDAKVIVMDKQGAANLHAALGEALTVWHEPSNEPLNTDLIFIERLSGKVIAGRHELGMYRDLNSKPVDCKHWTYLTTPKV